MDEVVVNGTRYVPATDTAPRIGVGITTHDRPETLAKALGHHREHLPPGAALVVVDDGSKRPIAGADHRFDRSQGIVAAKNKALELLMDAGVEHLFLWDDDAWPIDTEWWQPYAASEEPHLAFQFLDLSGPRKLHDIAEVYRDDRHVAYTGQRGVMLYYHRSVIEKVGGFDPIYGSMYEHSDLANRIHAAGLTTWRYADVVGSEKLIYSLDEHEAVERTIPTGERARLAKRNAQIHNERRDLGYAGYVEYRTQRNVVLTHLLTAEPDPQRGKRWDPKADIITTWARSIRGADAIVLTDRDLIGNPAPATAELVPVAQDQHAYRARWTHSYRWLRAHREVRWIWCTDGSDVIMQAPPWDHMKPGTLYVGSEAKILADDWMRRSHPAGRYQQLIDDHPHHVLLNCGLVGGDRTTVLELLHHMVTEFDDLAAERFWKIETPGTEVGDMGAFNRVIYTRFADRHVTGPLVHTIFKAEERNGFSWFKHR